MVTTAGVNNIQLGAFFAALALRFIAAGESVFRVGPELPLKQLRVRFFFKLLFCRAIATHVLVVCDV